MWLWLLTISPKDLTPSHITILFLSEFIKVLSLNCSVCIQTEIFTTQKTFDPDFIHILTNKVSIEAFLWAKSTFKGNKVFKV